MSVRELLTDDTYARKEYVAPSYQSLAFETSGLMQTSPFPGTKPESGDSEDNVPGSTEEDNPE